VHPSKLRGEALDEEFVLSIQAIDSKVALLSVHFMEAIVSYLFDDVAFVINNLWILTKHEGEMRGHFITGFFQTWLAIFHYECFYLTEKRIHKRLARLSHRRVQNWSTTGTEMLLGPTSLLDAMESLCVAKSPINNVIVAFQHAASICNANRCRLFEGLAYERLTKAVHFYEPEGVQYSIYQHKAVELYRTWGAVEKANHLEKLFDINWH
jgi:hypothetical protein